MQHFPKIDGLRALAVASVLVTHYFPNDHWTNALPWGGVYLFFGISGFLITGILLDARKNSGNISIIRPYYGRRILRIFPPYYLLLGLYLILGVKFVDGSGPAMVFYYFNFYQAFDLGGYDYLGHCWTLCIEEQFYLIWPWIILFVPKSRLMFFAILLFILAPLSRYFLEAQGWSYIAVRNMPSSALDCLVGGALVAMIQRNESPKLLAWWRLNYGWFIFIGVTLYWGTHFFPEFLGTHLVYGLLGIALASMGIIQYATESHQTPLDYFLKNPAVRYIGRISYGIYLYQFVTLFPMYKLISLSGNNTLFSNEYFFALIWTILTISLAALSWHFFEAPLLRLKKYFRYTKPNK